MTVSADDYHWLFEGDNGGFLAENHCSTLVGHLAPRDVVRLLGATIEREATFHQITTQEDLEPDPDRSYLAIADMGGCTLILETFSAIGYDDREMLSRGTAVTSHYLTINCDTRFSYIRDGVTVLEFEPFYGGEAETMRVAGFEGGRYAEAAFALADSLIGAGLTRDLIERATYLYAGVPAR